MQTNTTTYDEVIQLVQQWSPSQRFSLVQVIFQSLAPEINPVVSQRKNTLSKALGLLATTSPAPTDAQVKEWLNDRRIEKYS